jgi:hypothetical protein
LRNQPGKTSLKLDARLLEAEAHSASSRWKHIEDLTHRELALLLATRVSDHAQTPQQLAMNAECHYEDALPVLKRLAERGIVEPIENWDGSTVLVFSPCDYAQAVYDEIYGPLEI